MDGIRSLWDRIKQVFTDYIRCNLLDAVIIGVLNAVYLYFMEMPYIAVISVTAGVTNLIPTFGPVIGALVGCILLLFGEPLNALWFLIFTVLLQLLDSYLIKPKLFGSKLGVPSIVVLAATLLGGWLFGVPGMLLAVPAAAVVLALAREHRKK